MISYFDTSLLVKLYLEEEDSPEARRIAGRGDMTVTLSWLSDVEMAAAMHSRAFRAAPGVEKVQIESAYGAFVEERSLWMYQSIPMDAGVFDLARTFANQHGGLLGVRALDVLHVAAAVLGGATLFGTFDRRQGRLAEVVGLTLLP